MKLIYLSILLTLIHRPADAQADSISRESSIGAHPRLLMTSADEAVIRRNINASAAWKSVHRAILQKCDSLLTLPPSERIMTGIRLDNDRLCMYRIVYLSYAWRMTREKKYYNKAESELLAVAQFHDWNPSHFLDVAELTAAEAIGYDWLYQDLPEKKRQLVRAAILQKGIAPSYDTQYHCYRKWLSVTNNWNQVCNAGISFGALAVFESDPEFASSVINRSLKSIVISMKDYNPDGAYPEGFGYWGYGSTYNVMFMSALRTAFHSDFGLSGQQGFLKSPYYIQNMVGPTGLCFNYSDGAAKVFLQPAMFWFADELKDHTLLWNSKTLLQADKLPEQLSLRTLPFAIIWGSGIDLNDIPAPKTRLWVGQGRNPVALMHTSWTAPSAIFVGIKGGSPLTTHAHMDIGSFVMDADGVRWAMDLGYQEYNTLEARNIDLWEDKQDGQRWRIFRYNNFAHNTLAVDGQLQRVTGKAAITGQSDSATFLSAQTDLSAMYAGQVRNVQRGIAIVDDRYVVVHDEVTAKDTATTLRWSMLTAADVSIISRNGAELTRDGKKLIMTVQGNTNLHLKTWSTVPPTDYDSPNPGTIIVGYEAEIPPGAKGIFDVILTPGSDEGTWIKPTAMLQQWPHDSPNK